MLKKALLSRFDEIECPPVQIVPTSPLPAENISSEDNLFEEVASLTKETSRDLPSEAIVSLEKTQQPKFMELKEVVLLEEIQQPKLIKLEGYDALEKIFSTPDGKININLKKTISKNFEINFSVFCNDHYPSNELLFSCLSQVFSRKIHDKTSLSRMKKILKRGEGFDFLKLSQIITWTTVDLEAEISINKLNLRPKIILLGIIMVFCKRWESFFLYNRGIKEFCNYLKLLYFDEEKIENKKHSLRQTNNKPMKRRKASDLNPAIHELKQQQEKTGLQELVEDIQNQLRPEVVIQPPFYGYPELYNGPYFFLPVPLALSPFSLEPMPAATQVRPEQNYFPQFNLFSTPCPLLTNVNGSVSAFSINRRK